MREKKTIYPRAQYNTQSQNNNDRFFTTLGRSKSDMEFFL